MAQIPDAQGRLKSRVFDGLSLPVATMLNFNAVEVLAAVTA